MDEREWPPDEEEEDEEGDDHHHADYAAAAFRDRRSTVTYRVSFRVKGANNKQVGMVGNTHF